VEELEVAEDVLFDFVGVGFAVELLQVGDELGDGVAAVAAGNDFKAGPVETESTFWHEENFLALVFAEADTSGELGFGVGVGSHGCATLARLAAMDSWEPPHLSSESAGFFATRIPE
jgi:hypothetical protein